MIYLNRAMAAELESAAICYAEIHLAVRMIDLYSRIAAPAEDNQRE